MKSIWFSRKTGFSVVPLWIECALRLLPSLPNAMVPAALSFFFFFLDFESPSLHFTRHSRLNSYMADRGLFFFSLSSVYIAATRARSSIHRQYIDYNHLSFYWLILDFCLRLLLYNLYLVSHYRALVIDYIRSVLSYGIAAVYCLLCLLCMLDAVIPACRFTFSYGMYRLSLETSGCYDLPAVRGGQRGEGLLFLRCFLTLCTFALLHFFELWLMFSFLVLVNDRVI